MERQISIADAEDAAREFFKSGKLLGFSAKTLTPMLKGNYFIQSLRNAHGNGRVYEVYKFKGNYQKGDITGVGLFNTSRQARNFYEKKLYPNIVKLEATSNFIDLNKY